MTNKKLFAEAILDAKSIKATALVNAKKALEETLTPKLQSMLTKKLNEMENTDENLDLEEGDSDLDEMLAELENENGMTEAEDDDTPADDVSEPAEPKTDGSSAFGGGGEEVGISDEDKISSLTVADLKDILRDVVTAELAAGGTDDMGLGDETGDVGMDDIGPDETAGDEFSAGSPDMGHGEDDDVDLDELLRELEAVDAPVSEVAKPTLEKKELAEAIRTIKILRKDLNEVNLLNAKLLYMNKIFKEKTLSESQKAKIIFTFDKANSPKEAKLIYETLSNSIVKQVVKKPITENRGFASKPAGVYKKPITENIIDNGIERWKFLAGIKK